VTLCESTANCATSASGEPTTEPTSILLIQDLQVRVVNAFTFELLRELTINIDRDYQPRNSKDPNPVVFGSFLSLARSHGRADRI
jgi:hypothetical protein